MIHTIFFDFGNVVCFFDHYRAVHKLCRFTHLAPEELFGRLYNGQLEDDYEAGRITHDDYVAGALLAGKLRCTREEFTANFVDVFWLNEPVVALLPRLARNHRLVLASNTNAAHFGHFSAAFRDALSPFQKLCTSYEAGARKPHPQFFAHCQRFADCPPEECLFIDDLPANVAGAERHGWKGIVYTGIESLLASLKGFGVCGPDAA